jgi:hypothetical protein
VIGQIKRALPLLGGSLAALTILAALVLRVMPPPHRPFEYMIAGTASTGVALAALFAILNRRTAAGK